ncbi:MAG TPA: glycosyltransferase [Candidatus Polarisedimenticolaceae bacterium]|nr:glycosyltransferase [Candidatus Polarisedimenticolaceae bacterium]
MPGRRLLFVTSGLARGGAEGFLARLVERLAIGGHACRVVSLGSGEPLAGVLAARGIPVEELGRAAWRLRGIVRAFQPEVLQGWMYRGNIAASYVRNAPAKIRPSLVWSVRQGLRDLDTSPWTTRMAVAWGARRSDLPAAIVYNAYDAARQHEAAGYDAERTRVIANGIDVSSYTRNPEVRRKVREALGLPGEAPAIVLFARWHPVKNHRGFVEAAGMLGRSRPDVRFVMAGAGVDRSNVELGSWLDAAGIRDRTRLLGDRSDVPDLLAAADLATLSSHAEALPNALLEAMAAGVPCVAPALGDIPDLIGEAGVLVRPDDPAALADGWERVLALEPAARALLGGEARARASDRFDIDRAAGSFASLYEEVLARK